MSVELGTNPNNGNAIRRPIIAAIGGLGLGIVAGMGIGHSIAAQGSEKEVQAFVAIGDAYTIQNPDLSMPGSTHPIPKDSEVTATCYVHPDRDEPQTPYLLHVVAESTGEKQVIGFMSAQMVVTADGSLSILVGDCNEELEPGY